MRGSPGLSRFSAPMNFGYGLAVIPASISDHASTSFGDTWFLTQRQHIAVEVWGEFAGDFIKGGAHAWTPEHWWLLDSVAAGVELLDVVADLLTLEGVYFRRRTTIRSLSHLESPDHHQAMRISDAQIAKLQQILKQQFGLDYSVEGAQDAGRAILRFVGLKLYQQLERDRLKDTSAGLRRDE